MTTEKPQTVRKLPRLKVRRRAFWKDAVNIPNALTMARIVAIPPVLYVVAMGTPLSAMIAAHMWGILSVTDFLDGYLARKMGVESVVGKFLDPLADKLFVMALLVYLVPMGRIPAWMVVVLLAREITVTGLRAIASSEGIVMGAQSGGKWKTAIQMLGIMFLIIHFPYRAIPFYAQPVNFNVVGQWLMLLSVVLSLASFVEYAKLFADGIEERDRAEA
ncbi:MAG: CDP-diacylglycerol--glycerol-3-phosphate 3-phosphatidyltransferase [Deltaproteobacteria bacterium]|nr:CDP-diacylglycerol--glycerol-3-phosphate 3-phosphatidyltransferase [Deltaproteobacteria bacterium]